MGESPSIRDLAERDESFRDYLSMVESQLTVQSAPARDNLATVVAEFYKEIGFDDAETLVSGLNLDLALAEELSLDNLGHVLDQVAAAVFADGAAPPGAQVDPTVVQDAAATLAQGGIQLSNLELYAASKAFDALARIVLEFGTDGGPSFAVRSETTGLGFGMELFTVTAASPYRTHSFFDNHPILGYLHAYELRFSATQFRSESPTGLVIVLHDLIDTFERGLEHLNDALGRGNLGLGAYEAASGRYNEFISRIKDEIDRLRAEESVVDLDAATAKPPVP